jgi:hypothetical protein
MQTNAEGKVIGESLSIEVRWNLGWSSVGGAGEYIPYNSSIGPL